MDDYDYDDDGKKSVFNAGVAQAERIDSLQRAINAARFNPLMMNPETGTFNYQVLIDSADNLISEGWGKFTDEERKQAALMLRVIKSYAEVFRPVEVDGEGKLQFNMKNYDRIMAYFTLLDRKIKELYDAHDLNSPSKGYDEGL